MPDVSAPLPGQPPPPMAGPDQVGLLLGVHGVISDMTANYELLLQEIIFCRPTGRCDAKDLAKYRRALCTTDAYRTLLVIWKESNFLCEEAVNQACVSRNYQDGKHLTAHSLAIDFAGSSPSLVAKLNSRIRTIGLAAATHQLVDREGVHNTKVILKGTSVLHEFMSELATRNILVISRFASVIPAISLVTDCVGTRKCTG